MLASLQDQKIGKRSPLGSLKTGFAPGGARQGGFYPVVIRNKQRIAPKPSAREKQKIVIPRFRPAASKPAAAHVNTRGNKPVITGEAPRKSRFMFISLAVLVVLGVIFLTSGILLVHDLPETESITLPGDNSVTVLLYAFAEPAGGEAPEGVKPDVEIPAPSILEMLRSTVYRVKKGDTLSEVAKTYRVSLGTLISFNNITDVRKITVGTELRIPNTNGLLYKVKAGDSLSRIAQRNNVSLNAILDANNLETSVIRVGQELFIPGAEMSGFELKKALGELFVYPVRGELSSPFGMRPDPFTGVQRMHYGIDLANNEGTPVFASMDGKVVSVGNNPKGFGKYIILQHQGGYQTLYAHLSKIIVSVGQSVSQKAKIGEMGTTGLSTGPHLHFAVYKNQVPVDPLKYLN